VAAPVGNQNAAKARKWREAIQRALARAEGSVDAGLDKAADKLVALMAEGDKWAIDHVADRLDGKVPQALIGGDDDDPPLKLKGVVELVRPPG
jgi:hypothetical protein